MSSSNKNISSPSLNTKVIRPRFSRSALKSRIIHLGFGAFHRAHQGIYTSEMLDKTNSDWGICEISLFGIDLIKQLREQDHLYSVVEKGTDTITAKISGAVVESVHPKLDGIQAVLDKMAEPQVAIVSLTVTEKGYCADLSTGRLDFNNTLVKADLVEPHSPMSAIGYIVEALRMRKYAGIKPFTVMSCDNIPDNSRMARQVILDYANKLDEDLGKWIEQYVTFPCTMVDRIVPAITYESFAELTQHLGVEDPCGIVCESYSQWVIEDDFVDGRPEWDVAGVIFVTDIQPFEEMKLRMLNGSHSFLAYLGYLAGYKYIYETMADDAFRNAVFKLMIDEQAVTLSMPEGTRLNEYADLLISRFSNASIKHETLQIATDGSQKLPQRLCESLRFHLESGSPSPWIILAIAGWMVYVGERDEQGESIVVDDPMLKQFRGAYEHAESAEEIVPSLLSLSSIFGNDFIQTTSVVSALIGAVAQLKTIGAQATVAQVLQIETK